MDAIACIHPVPASWLRNSDLAPFMPAYWCDLIDQRYAANTVRVYLCGVAHFARWACHCHLAVADLADGDVQRFLDEHLPGCNCPQPVQRSRHPLRAALHHLQALLERAGVLHARQADAVEDELRRFDAHMLHARGLAQATRTKRLRILRPFLEQFCRASADELTPPTAQGLRQFIAQQLQRWKPASAGGLTNALRSYVRFRAACGDQVDYLLPVIASPANWRLASLPQTLSASELTRLLAAFPPELPSGLRAYAMVRCVVDLGLRASEVVNLGLDDIDWLAGTLRIGQNKSRRVHLMPLPQASASAIANYLRTERPETANRHVFVRHVAPLDVPIGSDVVRNAIRAAYVRCGINNARVYALRHTLAGRLLNEGGTLKEVADVLRHRDLNTTLIYAKVDATRLAAVAMPWPGSAA
jgi:site-specific recombinase XerD